MNVVRIIVTSLGTAAVLTAPLAVPAWGSPGSPWSPDPRPVPSSVQTVHVDLAPSTTSIAQLPRRVAESSVTVASGSGVLQSPEIDVDAFSLVGVTWAEDSGVSPDELRIEVRTNDGSGWSDWQTMPSLDGGPDANTEEGRRSVHTATDPLWVGEASAVQTRIRALETADPNAEEPASAELPRALELQLVDPGTSAKDAHIDSAPPAAVSAAGARPVIISRARWGADESKKNCSIGYSSTVRAVTVHHTAGGNSYSTPAQAQAQLRADYAYHTDVLGWCDLGYNFVVDKFGNIYEGRSGGVDKPVAGAHAGGFNTDTVGISALGDYSKVAVPSAMVSAIAKVAAWKLDTHNRNPQGRVTLTSAGGTSKYAAGQNVTLPVIFGHRDTGLTECPGTHLYANLSSIRSQAAYSFRSASFVRSLYADMMGRDADEGGLRLWTSALDDGDHGRRSLVRALATSDEYLLLSVDRAYRDVLQRSPDSGGLQSWFEDLRAGRVRVETLRPSLLQSQEFYLRAGGTDAGWVDLQYRSVLGRSASAPEREHWSAVKRREGALQVVNGISGSAEAGMRRVNEAYGYYLGRGASQPEQEYWLPVVSAFGDENLREELTVSHEYFLRSAARFP
jgi:hypothetical protein